MNETMMPYEYQMQLAGTLQNWADTLERAALRQLDPHMLYKPALSKDGDSWCALHGANLMEGVAGFGNTPAEAMKAFDLAWLNQETKAVTP